MGNIGKSLESKQDSDVVDVRPMSFHPMVSDIHDMELTKLRSRKYVMHGLMLVVAIYIAAQYGFYFTKACVKSDYYTSNE